MGNPSGQAALNAERKYRKAHPRKRKPTGREAQQKRDRLQVIKSAINPCYLKEARAILSGTKTRMKAGD